MLDLSKWKDSNYNLMVLSGEWEFYWDELLSYEEVQSINKPDAIVDIPSVWNSYKVNHNCSIKAFFVASIKIESLSSISNPVLTPKKSTALKMPSSKEYPPYKSSVKEHHQLNGRNSIREKSIY